MKTLILLFILIRTAFAGESTLTITYQPLVGFGSSFINIAQVTCHDWYSHSGQPTQIGLISAANVPPTNNPKDATQDLNLASVYGVRFKTSDLADPPESYAITLNATRIPLAKQYDNTRETREQVVRASLECLRRCLPGKLQKTPVTLKCTEVDKPWMERIISDFNAHDRTKIFFTPKQN